MTVSPLVESPITGGDVASFHAGHHHRLYEKLGAHLAEQDGQRGARFAVWAPAAERVTVMGDFNGWDNASHPLAPIGSSGLHEGFVAGIGEGTHYKYHVTSRYGGYRADKADPFGFHHETAPETGSIVWSLGYDWGDERWMEERAERQGPRSPVSIYEVHLGSWRRGDGGRFLSYREVASELADYALANGFTHVELMPIGEHPFYGSWGYQGTGYFAPTSRYGTPQDFMYLVDHLHQRGIGVLLDWVPSHFPQNEHGLVYFDGTHLFEPEDPRLGWHPEWSSYIFDYGRPEVRAFLISSALFWLDRYHLDGLRVDAVASMLYRDYARQDGEWLPNRYGGNENLEAVQFLRQLNEEIGGSYPDVLSIAEESTAWPLVSRPTYAGGLGFSMKWDMGWMNDTLAYFREEPVHRRYHHGKLTFRMMYAWSESFCLALSHDEVVHGKGSLLGKMPGDDWQRFANLRLLFGWQWAQPGKKLLFMGGEIAQQREWSHDRALDWELLANGWNGGMQHWVRDLNRLYRDKPALHEQDFQAGGFEWVDCSDEEQSIVVLLRQDAAGDETILAAFNFTPVPRRNYRVGVPREGRWREIANSDSNLYGGSGTGNLGGVVASPLPMHGRRFSLPLTLPPLAVVFLEHDPEGGDWEDEPGQTEETS